MGDLVTTFPRRRMEQRAQATQRRRVDLEHALQRMEADKPVSLIAARGIQAPCDTEPEESA